MTWLLASVRNVDEAREAAAAGADVIDLKEPANGSLGALDPATIRSVVQAVRQEWPAMRLSAAIGDFAPGDVAGMLRMADTVGECGVDYVKVGIAPGPHARETLARVGSTRWRVVPVFLADDGLDFGLLRQACALRFPALMVDTADKAGGSLFDDVGMGDLLHFVHLAHAHGRMAGMAGSLGEQHLADVRVTGADIAGFRGALCAEGREGRLEGERVQALREQMTAPARPGS